VRQGEDEEGFLLPPFGTSPETSAPYLEAQILKTKTVSVYRRTGEDPALHLITGDGLVGALPLPFADAALRRAEMTREYLDLDRRVYCYEAEVGEQVLDPVTGKVLSKAGTYRYAVDLDTYLCAELFTAAESGSIG